MSSNILPNNSDNLAIRVNGLGKQYRIVARQKGRRRISEALMETLAAPIRRLRHPGQQQGKTELIWALQDVNFEIKAGEAVGVIGRNGAGKSTLLKILSRITAPTTGRVKLRGRVGALLEVGTGFHSELTGRENTYLNGAILGMSRQEVKRKFDEIVAFAEIEQFIDTPVKRYSSGMYMRLAFAVAAHLEPEILIVDEVLAVGDSAFQAKCLGRMNDVASEGRTVIFVSHNMASMKSLCQRIIWLDKGTVVADGVADDIIERYLTHSTTTEGEIVWPDGYAKTGVNELKLYSVRVLNTSDVVSVTHEMASGFTIEIEYRVFKRLPYCRVGWRINTNYGVIAIEAYDSDNTLYSGPVEPGTYVARSKIPGNLLNAGRYVIDINAGVPNVKKLAFLENLLTLNIEDTGGIGSNLPAARGGIIRTHLDWQRELKGTVVEPS